MGRTFLFALGASLTAAAFACSAPDPGFQGPAARGHSGVVGSTSGSGSSSGGSAATGSGSGSSSGGVSGSSSGSSSGGVVLDAGSGGGAIDSGVVTAATYGTGCTTNADCAGSIYDACQPIQQQMICTKTCVATADCPVPPTGGTCNANGYCK